VLLAVSTIGLKRNLYPILVLVLLVSGLLALLSIAWGIALLNHKRYGPAMYRGAIAAASVNLMATVPLTLYLASSDTFAYSLLFVDVLVVLPLGYWAVFLREAVCQTERMFRFVDAPERIRREDMPYLKTYTDLRELALSLVPPGEIDYALLGQVESLERLNLSGTKVSDDDVGQFLGLVNLQHLNLTRTPVTRAVIEILSPLGALREILLDEQTASAPPAPRVEAVAEPEVAPGPAPDLTPPALPTLPRRAFGSTAPEPEVVWIRPPVRASQPQAHAWPTGSINDPELPVLVKVALWVDAIACVFRLAQIFLLIILIEASGGMHDIALYVLVGIVLVQAAIVTSAICGAIAVLNHLRYGLGLYYLSMFLVVGMLVVQGLGTLINPDPQSRTPFVLLVLAVTTLIVVAWLVVLGEALRRVKRMFDFSDSPRLMTRDDFPHLTTYPDLTMLSLTLNSYLREEDCAILGRLTTLELLDLSKTGIGDAGVRHLEGLVHLEQLNLDGTKVTEAVFEILSRLPALKRVSLAGTQCRPEKVEAYESHRWKRDRRQEEARAIEVAPATLPSSFAERQDAVFEAMLAELTPAKAAPETPKG
jgi:hypothetical protein